MRKLVRKSLSWPIVGRIVGGLVVLVAALTIYWRTKVRRQRIKAAEREFREAGRVREAADLASARAVAAGRADMAVRAEGERRRAESMRLEARRRAEDAKRELAEARSDEAMARKINEMLGL